MTAVRLPPVLRQYAGDAKQVEATGGTLGQVVDQLVQDHPGLRDQLLTWTSSPYWIRSAFPWNPTTTLPQGIWRGKRRKLTPGMRPLTRV